jgi:hypothetical protein
MCRCIHVNLIFLLHFSFLSPVITCSCPHHIYVYLPILISNELPGVVSPESRTLQKSNLEVGAGNERVEIIDLLDCIQNNTRYYVRNVWLFVELSGIAGVSRRVAGNPGEVPTADRKSP